MEKDRLEKQIAFILEVDKEKNIFRQTHIHDYARQENDAEHAWHMALMIYLLKEYANEEIDLAKTMMMALIHDVVEIDAGDAYAYDAKAQENQKEREQKAAERIFGLLPNDQAQELRSLFEEYEENVTPEARFARAIDHFQPMLLNDLNGGKDWIAHDVCQSQIMKRQERTKLGSEVIWERAKKIVEENVAKGHVRKE